MTTKSLKPSCFVYDESAYVSDAPLDFPVLINISNTLVDEGTAVTLRCHVTSGGNPPLFWSWYCGDMPMERGLSDGGNWSEVTFIATKMYHQRACYCRLNSTSEKIKYDKRSQKKFITLKSKSSLIIWQLIIFFPCYVVNIFTFSWTHMFPLTCLCCHYKSSVTNSGNCILHCTIPKPSPQRKTSSYKDAYLQLL